MLAVAAVVWFVLRPPSCSAPDQAPVWLAGLYVLERLAYSAWMTEVGTEVPPTEAEGGLGPRRITLACPRLVIRQRNSALAGDLFVNAVVPPAVPGSTIC